jgi:hypothetical protein
VEKEMGISELKEMNNHIKRRPSPSKKHDWDWTIVDQGNSRKYFKNGRQIIMFPSFRFSMQNNKHRRR